MYVSKWYVGILFVLCITNSNSQSRKWLTDQRTPCDIMVDVVNNLGLNTLKIHNINNENNIAISPYGLVSILTALLEGVKGLGALEIQKCGGYPANIDVIRVGLRDIHRLLRSYFIPQEGFLSGLSLSSEKVILRPEYQSILRFYGYDLTSFNTPIYPNHATTPMNNMTTTTIMESTTDMLSTDTTMESTTETVTKATIPQEDDTTTSKQETTLETTLPPTTTSRSTTTDRITIMTTPLETSETKIVTVTETPSTTITTTSLPTTTLITTIPTTLPPRTTTVITTTISTTTTKLPETTTNIPTTITTLGTTTAVPKTTNTTTTIPTTTPRATETTTGNTVTTTRNTVTTLGNTITTLGNTITTLGNTITTTTPPGTTTQLGETSTLRIRRVGRSLTTETTITATEYSETSAESKGSSSNLKTKRIGRSLVDYFIARYYDNQASDIYDSEGSGYGMKYSFLVGGKFQEPNVHFMTYDVVLPFLYVHSLNALALKFPLDSPKYYLLLVLPIETDGIDRLICDIGKAATLKEIVSNLRPTYVRAVIPSFSLRGFVILTSTLQKLGIREIFEPQHTDFSPMTDDKDIYVTNIEQAITVMIKNYMDENPIYKNRNYYQYGPVEFKATHPFLYFVMDSEIDVTLVAGKVINPINSRIQ